MFGAVDPAKLVRPGVLERHWRAGQTLFADYGGRRLVVTVLEASVIRIRLAPDGMPAPRRSWAVTRPDEAYPPAHFSIAEAPHHLTVTTDRLLIEVAREGGRVRIYERESGRVVLDDGQDGGPAWDVADGSAVWIKCMPPDERYYGFGERTGLLDKRGRRYT